VGGVDLGQVGQLDGDQPERDRDRLGLVDPPVVGDEVQGAGELGAALGVGKLQLGLHEAQLHLECIRQGVGEGRSVLVHT
jgi:hypothetical protein